MPDASYCVRSCDRLTLHMRQTVISQIWTKMMNGEITGESDEQTPFDAGVSVCLKYERK